MLQFLFSFGLFSFFCGGVFACVCRGVVSVNDLKMQYNLHFVGGVCCVPPHCLLCLFL